MNFKEIINKIFDIGMNLYPTLCAFMIMSYVILHYTEHSYIIIFLLSLCALIFVFIGLEYERLNDRIKKLEEKK